ncbi:MAG: flagellar hook-length control protein FliK [Hyphomicrobiaceae bacterium]
MTNTSYISTDVAHRLDKQRTDGRTANKEAGTESERGTDKASFAQLVKQTDGRSDDASSVVSRGVKATDAVGQVTQHEPSLDQEAAEVGSKQAKSSALHGKMSANERLAGGLAAQEPARGTAKGSAAMGPKPEMAALPQASDAIGISSGANSDLETAATRRVAPQVELSGEDVSASESSAETQGELSAADGGAGEADMPTATAERNSQPSPVMRADDSDLQPTTVVHGNEISPSDERAAMAATAAVSARPVSAGAGSTEQRTVTREPDQSIQAVRPTGDGVQQQTAAQEAEALRTVAQGAGSDGQFLAVTAEEQGQLLPEAKRAEGAALPRADEARSLPNERTTPAAPSAVLAEAAVVRRLADATHAGRRVLNESTAAPRGFDASRDLGGNVIERMTTNARLERPEQMARLAFETVSVQRSLGGGEQVMAVQDDIESAAPNITVGATLRESASPAMPNPVTSTGPNTGIAIGSLYGQLVESVTSRDGLPRSGAEFRLLATQGGVHTTPDQIKVMQLHLQPRELGEIVIRLALRGDKLELRVQTARAATADLLMSDQRVLVEALQQKNFDIDSVTIQLVDPDRGNTGQSGLPNGAQARAGQGDSFQAATQGQSSQDHDTANGGEGGGDVDLDDDQGQNEQAADLAGGRRNIYL